MIIIHSGRQGYTRRGGGSGICLTFYHRGTTTKFVTFGFMRGPVGMLTLGVAVVDGFTCRAFLEVVTTISAGGAGGWRRCR